MARFGIVAVLVSLAVVALAGNPPWMENLNNVENANRAKHDQLPLVIEDALSKMAQEWANKLATECNKLVKESHAPMEKRIYKDLVAAGENIAASYQNDPKGAMTEAESFAPKAGSNWYAEIADYPWPVYKDQTLPKGVQVGHFTQQVWKGSKVVGYGLGVNPKCEKIFVVARYWPLGNMNRAKGNYANHVFPPKGL